VDQELADATAYMHWETLRVHTPDCSTFLRDVTSWPPS